MTRRRDFLKLGTATAVRTGLSGAPFERARALVRSGVLGRVDFCRIGDATMLTVAERLTSGCIIEVDLTFQGAAFMGSRATLLVTQAGCRVFAENT